MKDFEGESDSICIRELELRVKVGVPDEERAQPQRLTISIRIWPKMRFDDLNDEIARAVNYADVAREVKEFSEDRADKLIETLAETIAAHLLRTFPVRKVQLELRKFILPDVEYVAVMLTREALGRA